MTFKNNYTAIISIKINYIMTNTIHEILGVNPKNHDSLAPQEKIKEILSGKFQLYFNKIIKEY